MKKCFVIMPFEARFNGIWTEIIAPTVKSLGHTAIRADNIFTVGSILQDLFRELDTADYIICDLTIHNPNVYYELGYAHALKKKVILITQDISALPFDLKHQRVVVYQDNAAGAAKLKSDLLIFINNL